MQKLPPTNNSNTAMLIIIMVLLFGIIIAYFGNHKGNTDVEEEFNKLLDTNLR